MIRVDMAERMAANAHEARAAAASRSTRRSVTSLGLLPETVAKLMRDIGFRPGDAETPAGSGAAASAAGRRARRKPGLARISPRWRG